MKNISRSYLHKYSHNHRCKYSTNQFIGISLENHTKDYLDRALIPWLDGYPYIISAEITIHVNYPLALNNGFLLLRPRNLLSPQALIRAGIALCIIFMLFVLIFLLRYFFDALISLSCCTIDRIYPFSYCQVFKAYRILIAMISKGLLMLTLYKSRDKSEESHK